MNDTTKEAGQPASRPSESWQDGALKDGYFVCLLALGILLAVPFFYPTWVFADWSQPARATLLWFGVVLYWVVSVGDGPFNRIEGSRRRWLAERLSNIGLALLAGTSVAAVFWAVLYHHPLRWAALSVAVVSGLVLAWVAVRRRERLIEVSGLHYAVAFVGPVSALVALTRSDDARTLACIGLIASIVTGLGLMLNWYQHRRHQPRPEPPTGHPAA